MCGFVGFLQRNNLHSFLNLDPALDSLSRRGPDGCGTLHITVGDWQVALGHRRLAIIDLDVRSAQPFRRGDITLVFNGELYNYRELRDELSRYGAQFITESDTEVLAAAWERWGIDSLTHIDGMYAIAALNTTNGTLTLARDPFGEKPIFLSTSANSIAFGSTIDAVLATNGTSNFSLEPNWVDAFITLGFAPAPLTSRPGIEKLAAGELRIFNLYEGTWRIEHSGAFDYPNQLEYSRKFDVCEFEYLITRSLDRRLRADVPIALLLSGGVDSSYIAAIAKHHLGRDLLAVTIRDRIDSTEEVDRASSVCHSLGIQHQVASCFDRPFTHILSRSLSAMDEPIADPAFPLLFDLFSHVPSEIRVVLTGDGADELFLSYTNYYRFLRGYKLSSSPLSLRCLSSFLSLRPSFLGNIGYRLVEQYIYRAHLSTGDRFRSMSLLNGWDKLEQIKFTRNLLPTGHGPDVLWQHSFDNELPEYLLTKTDRASMFHSLEARTPYLSREVLRYLFECDPSSIGLGRKEGIIDRLQNHYRLPLRFVKRGFFASGQNNLTRSRVTWHPILLEHPTVARILRSSHSLHNIDSLLYYRLYVLNSWLQVRCA